MTLVLFVHENYTPLILSFDVCGWALYAYTSENTFRDTIALTIGAYSSETDLTCE